MYLFHLYALKINSNDPDSNESRSKHSHNRNNDKNNNKKINKIHGGLSKVNLLKVNYKDLCNKLWLETTRELLVFKQQQQKQNQTLRFPILYRIQLFYWASFWLKLSHLFFFFYFFFTTYITIIKDCKEFKEQNKNNNNNKNFNIKKQRVN